MKKLLTILTICLAASLAAVSCDSGASAGADPDGRHPAAQEEQPQGSGGEGGQEEQSPAGQEEGEGGTAQEGDGQEQGGDTQEEQDATDYSTAEKLENRTFSRYAQDAEAGDEWVWLKESIEFGAIDKDAKAIPITIRHYYQTTQNPEGDDPTAATTEDADKRRTSSYDIAESSIEGDAIDASGLDAERDFDKEFSLNGNTYENCGQKMKWAKLLENNIFNYSLPPFYNINHRFYSIVNDTIPMDSPSSIRPICYYDVDSVSEIQKASNTADPVKFRVWKITETSYINGEDNDGNGIEKFIKL